MKAPTAAGEPGLGRSQGERRLNGPVQIQMAPMHRTRALLLETAVGLLDTNPPDRVTLDAVLTESGVAKGSLYHFFTDFPDLIDHAQILRFARFVDASLGSIEFVMNQATSKETFLSGLRVVTDSTRGDAASGIRRDWIWALGQATIRPDFHRMLGEEQQRLTDGLANLVRDVQQRGWFRSDLDPVAVSVLIQSYTFGRFVNDITPQRMRQEDWNYLLDSVIARTLMA